jgi:hypothetical protein
MSYRPKPELSNVPAIPDHIYYDVLITNFNSTTGTPIPIYFNENRTNPILPVTGEYEMSIIRFSVDTTDLPIFIPVIKPYSKSVNQTNYSITLSIKPVGSSITYTAQAPVIWVTQDNSAPIPPPPYNNTNSGLQSNVGTYYYCYSFQHFQELITTTLVNVFQELQVLVAAAGYTDLVGVLPPVMSWDTVTECAVLSFPQFNNLGNPCFDTRYIDNSGNLIVNTNGVKIYFNSPLFQLFNSFTAQFQGSNASIPVSATSVGDIYQYNGTNFAWYPNTDGTYGFTSFPGTNYQLTVINAGGTNQIILPNIYPVTYQPTASPPLLKGLYLQVFQEYSTVCNWTPVSSIVFVSNTIPIVSNQIASPTIYNENQIIIGDGNNAKFAQVITDIESLGNNNYKPSLLYNPTAEYRMISMTGNRPLTNVDVSVFWKNKLGVLIPLNLLSGGSCSLKFLFRKRIV